jgi:hypothetical protein
MPTSTKGSDIVAQKTNTWNKVSIMPKRFFTTIIQLINRLVDKSAQTQSHSKSASMGQCRLKVCRLAKCYSPNYTNWPMNNLKLTGRNPSRVFKSRCGRACLCHAIALITKTAQSHLNLKTRPKQLLGYLGIHFLIFVIFLFPQNTYKTSSAMFS